MDCDLESILCENMVNYDIPIDKRIFNFVIKTIKLLKEMKSNPVSMVLINQLTKSATSIGANYEEAQGASSRKDFLNKVTIAHKESKETVY